MSTTPGIRFGVLAGTAAVALVLIVPAVVGAQDAAGFDAFIQSGTCAAPSDDVHVKLKSDGPHDLEPYEAKLEGGDKTTVLGYYGSPQAPGFGLSAIYTDQDFSLVITDTDSGAPVACGDILQPDADRFREVGVTVVQLLPVGGTNVEGLATMERVRMQREDDVTPTRVRIVLSTDAAAVGGPATEAVGYDGFVQGGFCDAPTNRVRVSLKSRGAHDVKPFLAKSSTGDPVTTAYYGAPAAPGFGFASTYTKQKFSLVVSDTETGSPLACGNILQADDDDFTQAGILLVQLQPIAGSGVAGYALVERTATQREIDVAPTRVRIALFAPPISG